MNNQERNDTRWNICTVVSLMAKISIDELWKYIYFLPVTILRGKFVECKHTTVLTDNNAMCMLHLDNYRPIYLENTLLFDYLCWNPILEYCLNAYRNIHLYQCHQTSLQKLQVNLYITVFMLLCAHILSIMYHMYLMCNYLVELLVITQTFDSSELK